VNDSCSSTHGKICVNAVFISPSGEWKLGGFELFSNTKEDSPTLYVRDSLYCVPFPEITPTVYGRIVPGLVSMGISGDQEGRLVGFETVKIIYLYIWISTSSNYLDVDMILQ
jgi:hypothetical protein